jgi:putative endonuclease
MRQQPLSRFMYNAYIIKSAVKDWYYIGHSADLENRIKIHNSGRSKATKPYRPFILIYKEEFNTKGEAFKREQQIKRYRHGEAFKKLIGV